MVRGEKKGRAAPSSLKDTERLYHNKLDFEERNQASDYLERMHQKVDGELDVAAKRALMQVSIASYFELLRYVVVISDEGPFIARLLPSTLTLTDKISCYSHRLPFPSVESRCRPHPG